MTVTSYARVQRLKRLIALLPPAATAPAACPDGGRLLNVLADLYGPGDSREPRRRLQRDLLDLLRNGRIEAVNPGHKPLRFRRLGDDLLEDTLIWQKTLQQIYDLVADVVPQGRLDRLWAHLMNELNGPLLDEQRLRILPDTLRLRPPAIYPEVLHAVIQALVQRCALQVLYEDAKGMRGEALIHPQALVHRGPIPYLFALKNDEEGPVRLYALHRMIRAESRTATPARGAAGFDLDRAIALGLADFGKGRLIDLELLVRGYYVPLLEACPLTADQTLMYEPEGSDFTLRVEVRLPSTGSLLRWLLGGGNNLQVVAPPELLDVMASRSTKTAALYPGDSQAPAAQLEHSGRTTMI